MAAFETIEAWLYWVLLITVPFVLIVAATFGYFEATVAAFIALLTAERFAHSPWV